MTVYTTGDTEFCIINACINMYTEFIIIFLLRLVWLLNIITQLKLFVSVYLFFKAIIPAKILKPPWGFVKLNFNMLKHLVPSEQSHHKPMGIHCCGPLNLSLGASVPHLLHFSSMPSVIRKPMRHLWWNYHAWKQLWVISGNNQSVGYQLHNSAIKSVLTGKIKTKDYCKELE